MSTGQTSNSSCSSLKNNISTPAILLGLSSHDLNQESPTTVLESTMPPNLPSHDLSPRDSDYSNPLPVATVPTLPPFTICGPKEIPYTTQKAKTLPDNNPSVNTPDESSSHDFNETPLFNPPIPSYLMITRSKVGIFKKKAFTAFSSPTPTKP